MGKTSMSYHWSNEVWSDLGYLDSHHQEHAPTDMGYPLVVTIVMHASIWRDGQ